MVSCLAVRVEVSPSPIATAENCVSQHLLALSRSHRESKLPDFREKGRAAKTVEVALPGSQSAHVELHGPVCACCRLRVNCRHYWNHAAGGRDITSDRKKVGLLPWRDPRPQDDAVGERIATCHTVVEAALDATTQLRSGNQQQQQQRRRRHPQGILLISLIWPSGPGGTCTARGAAAHIHCCYICTYVKYRSI
eukprot:COSAG05_NODE_2288_length_3271_cov_9.717528_2_plen_194_part_00